MWNLILFALEKSQWLVKSQRIHSLEDSGWLDFSGICASTVIGTSFLFPDINTEKQSPK